MYVCDPDASRPQLVVTNWQTGGRLAGATQLTRFSASTDPASLELFFDDEVRRYQAPEAATPGRAPGHQLDVFSLGAVAYRIFAGDAPAGTPEELATAVRDSGVNLAAAVDGMPGALVNAVYDATCGDPSRRLSSVAAFRAELERVWEELTAPEPVVDPLVARKRDVLDAGLTVLRRLDARGAVMSAVEVAEALVATRGSYTAEPKRTAQAVGLVRAAVETELALGGDARLAIQRLRHPDAVQRLRHPHTVQRLRQPDTVLVGREPDDPSAETTAADLLAYVVGLGDRAAKLASAEPLPSRQRAVEELRTVPVPAGMPAVTELRLLQLAAAGSNGRAEVNAQGQLYPDAMPAERALRLTAGSLIGQRLTPDEVRGRVRARFPHAQELPGRPALTDLLRSCGVPLTWHPAERQYGPPAVLSVLTGTRTGTTLGGALLTAAQADEVGAKLTGAIERRAFLAVLAPIRRLVPARRALLARLRLVEIDVTAIMLARLRGLGYPWEAIVAADTGSPEDANFRSLTELVRHQVVPAISDALAATDRPVLLTEVAPLARYGELRLLRELADPSRPRPAARRPGCCWCRPAGRSRPCWTGCDCR